MLATLVIGLREGLEAALIVGIIAAFLRTNGKSLRAMWIGVGAAVALSICVGLGLEIVSASLPQAQQEGLETVIGAVAVVFVTGMIVWMSRHARGMRSELEGSAEAALGRGGAWALAAMAFLAVLKEGFETSVFLLATFQSSSSVPAAVGGAVIGIALAVALGIGIYKGGVKLNLGSFFKGTGVFLIFVAAGLVVSALRTAHEAGWINIGQGRTVDLSWLAPSGSVQAALVTGVLGIPADPRVIEVLGWALYLIPVLSYTLWPAAWKPAAAHVPRVQFAFAGALAVVALAFALAMPAATIHPSPTRATIVGSDGSAAGKATAIVSEQQAVLSIAGVDADDLRFSAESRKSDLHSNLATTRWQLQETATPNDHPDSLTVSELAELMGGRLPVGVDAQQNPGPYSSSWSARTVHTLWTVGDQLLDATSKSATVLTISGGGLPSPRTLSLPPAASENWSVSSSFVEKVADAAHASAVAAQERQLWSVWLPLIFAAAALILATYGLRGRARLRRAPNLPLPAPSHKESSYAA